ncbi:TraR/DksA C4-type zinc finger protein [Saliterribacillus persicus]|uniref:TraR/DksA family transcriptional regulator n=1 Tax=Saliterribacillus persicus TaxID=930114 RepID=A0A368XWM3_9BACI|nr:TraR/DksA C4-type zinc finger protein [Saliterribacillus persicus]RCW71869.1 TraR/DksA family transcriptional regulator [Saliterribacillus persicus]
MLHRSQLEQCKQELLSQKNALKKHLSDHFGLEIEQNKETSSELSNYDNHPGDTGTELFEREKDIALNEHAEQEMKQIEEALNAIENGTYGICEQCGKDIPAERLIALPTTNRCITHADKHIPHTRPVEEDIIHAGLNEVKTENGEEKATLFDAEDAWQSVEKYGSSDSPSDFNETNEDYDNMFFNSDEQIGSVEDIEGFLLADKNGKFIGVNEKHESYENYLDENEVNSILSTDK